MQRWTRHCHAVGASFSLAEGVGRWCTVTIYSYLLYLRLPTLSLWPLLQALGTTC